MKAALVRLVPFLWYRLGLIALWRRVPRAVRRRLGNVMLNKGPDARIRAEKPLAPLFACGLLQSTTAFGWVTRSTLALAAEAGLEAYPVDLSHVLDRKHDAEEVDPPRLAPALVHGSGTLVLHFNPNQFRYVQSFLPAGLLDRKYVIASCAWELERVPPDWVGWTALADELWVPSHFVANAFRQAGIALPCRVVPPLFGAPGHIGPQRSRFGFHEDEFVVLTAFSFGSGLARKNPTAAVAAFRKAFADAKAKARLVLKVSDTAARPEDWARFRDEVADDPRITILDERLDDAAMWGLIASCDVILSLHRAEGFGMMPAQGMLLGKAVVATGWSGNLDFMTDAVAALVPYSLVAVEDPDGVFADLGARWADPDVAAAAAALTKLYADRNWCKALGESGKRHVETYLGERRHDFLAFLRQIGPASPAPHRSTPPPGTA